MNTNKLVLTATIIIGVSILGFALITTGGQLMLRESELQQLEVEKSEVKLKEAVEKKQKEAVTDGLIGLMEVCVDFAIKDYKDKWELNCPKYGTPIPEGEESDKSCNLPSYISDKLEADLSNERRVCFDAYNPSQYRKK